MAEDERGVSLGRINEMDGTGLYERPNWPLAAKRRVSSAGGKTAGSEHEGGGENGLTRVHSAAVMRKSEDISSALDFPEGDVSDIDEDEVSEPQESEDIMERTIEFSPQTNGFGSIERPNISPLGVSDIPAASQAHRGEETPTFDSTSRNHLENERQQAAWNQQPSPLLAQSPRFANFSAPQRSPNRYHFERTVSPATDVSSGLSSPRHDQFPLDHEQQHPDEVAIPTASEAEAAHRPHSPTTPRVNQTVPMTNGHARGSSLMQSTLPPPRSASRASSLYNTSTHTPHNKDRVRYSWQSLLDDEPNRPRIHIIKLVSEVATASAGFPGGEAFGFSISPGGRRIAAYNSARLYVLQTAALPVGISQDYALKRRPLAVEIVDEGHVLAILADSHTINIYGLGRQRLRRTRTIKTDFPTNCIALAATGGLLAAAYEGGVEIFSLAASALPTDRRAVRSVKMDRLAFSEDGSALLGTTTRINVSSTVVVSVPVFPAAPSGIPTHDELKEAWCSELLHPENVRNSSHTAFMRENRASCNDRVFSWNGLADTFGILNISDMQYGNVDFPVVISPPLSTCGGLGAAIHSCPAIDEHGDTVAMIVNDRTIRLYIVPHQVDDDGTTVEAHSIDHELDEGYGCPFNEVRWMYSSASLPAPLHNQTQVRGRLIVTSPGGMVELGTSEGAVDDAEGGRIILFDFDPQFAGQPGQTFSLTLGKSPPQMLEEEQVNHADEIALVRRRTVNQSKNTGLSQRPTGLGRAATTFNRDRSLRSVPPTAGLRSGRGSVLSINSLQSDAARSLPDLLEASELGDTFDEPYVQGAPRSGASLQRAATNAQIHRFQTLEERNQERVSVDSSGNFLPLPEYSEEPNAPLPSRFRAMAGLDAPPQPLPKPSIITSAGSSQASASNAPATAPASMAETFNGEEAFRQAASAAAATNALQPATTRSTSSAVPRSDTSNSMPRGPQRAYSNAVSPLGNGPPPSLIGDWENVSPVGTNPTNGSWMPTRSGTARNGSVRSPTPTMRSPIPEDNIVSPLAGPGQPNNPFDRAHQTVSQRYSASLLSSSGQTNGIPQRAPSAASSFRPMSSDESSTSSLSAGARRLPPHMQAVRNAAASAASASLFPPNQPANHVPLPALLSQPGSAAHPITAWHPPAASTATSPPRSAPGLGHASKSSVHSRNAFAEAAQKKRRGFFRRRAKTEPSTPGGYSARVGVGGNDIMDTKNTGTRMSRGEGKCIMM